MSDQSPFGGAPSSANSSRPALPGGSVVVRPTQDELLDAIASDLYMHAAACVREFGDFHLALSVWPEAEALYLRLLYDPRFRDLPWKRTHLWLVEENFSQNRFEVLEQAIVLQSDIPQQQVHRPAQTQDYQAELQESLGWREKGHDRLDFALLPLLERGQTHGSRSAGPAAALVETRPGQVLMTRRLLEATRFIAIAALGSGSVEGVREIVTRGTRRSGAGSDRLFADEISPLGGELRWYVDQSACRSETGREGEG